MRFDTSGPITLSGWLEKVSVDTRELVAAMGRIPGWEYDPSTTGGTVVPRRQRTPPGGWVSMFGRGNWTNTSEPPWLMAMRLRQDDFSSGKAFRQSRAYDWKDLQRRKSEAPPGGYGPESDGGRRLRWARQIQRRAYAEDPLADGSRYRSDRLRVSPSVQGAPLPLPLEAVRAKDPDAGRIILGKPTVAGGDFLPARHHRAARAVTLMHEVDERRLPVKRTSPGWTHVSPEVLFNESNLVNRLKGPSSQTIRDNLTTLRIDTGEAADLERMIQRFSGGRYSYQYGDHMPKAMKRAVVRWLQRNGR